MLTVLDLLSNGWRKEIKQTNKLKLNQQNKMWWTNNEQNENKNLCKQNKIITMQNMENEGLFLTFIKTTIKPTNFTWKTKKGPLMQKHQDFIARQYNCSTSFPMYIVVNKAAPWKKFFPTDRKKKTFTKQHMGYLLAAFIFPSIDREFSWPTRCFYIHLLFQIESNK